MNKKQKNFYIIIVLLLTLTITTKALASLTFTTNAITGSGIINLNPTGQPVTVNGDLTVTGNCTGCGGGGTAPAGSNGDLQMKNDSSLAASPVNCTDESCSIGATTLKKTLPGITSGASQSGAVWPVPNIVRLTVNDTNANPSNRAVSGVGSYLDISPVSDDTGYFFGDGFDTDVDVVTGNSKNITQLDAFAGYVNHFGTGVLTYAYGIETGVGSGVGSTTTNSTLAHFSGVQQGTIGTLIGVDVQELNFDATITTAVQGIKIEDLTGFSAPIVQALNYNDTFIVDKTGVVTAAGYKSSDSTAGATATVVVKGSAGSNCNLVYKNGLFVSTTCP